MSQGFVSLVPQTRWLLPLESTMAPPLPLPGLSGGLEDLRDYDEGWG